MMMYLWVPRRAVKSAHSFEFWVLLLERYLFVAEGMHQVYELSNYCIRRCLLFDTQLENAMKSLIEQFPEFPRFTPKLKFELLDCREIYFDTFDLCPSVYPVGYLKFVVSNDLVDGYLQFFVLLHLFLTFPIGISSADRAFSVLRRLKTH